MASDGVFSDRNGIAVPGDAQDEPADDATVERSISDPSAENWGDMIQTALLGDIDDGLVDAGSLAGRPSAGTTAPRFFIITNGGESGDQHYLTFNDDTEWHLVIPLNVRNFADSSQSPYDISYGESLWVDASGGTVDVNLPAVKDRARLRVVVIDSTNDVNLVRNSGTDTIDGDASDVALTAEGTIELEGNNGEAWRRTTVESEQFITKVDAVLDSPNGHIPISLLEDTESAEIAVPVPDGETLTVYRWGCYKIADSTAPAGLRVELLDDADTAQAQENTVNTENSTGVASHANTSGSLSVFKLRVINATGSALTTDGVAAHFGYVVE